MTNELKPCPFCGSIYIKVLELGYIKEISQHYVMCENCYATTYQYYRYRDRAIKAWNMRANKENTNETK